MEVVSKILTAGEKSFKEVCDVANLLNRTFRAEVNRSCGCMSMSETARKVSILLL